MFSVDRSDGVTRLARPETVWLSTGFDGGRRRTDAAYNVTVPEGWPHQSLADYVADRVADAGFGTADGPALLTGVAQRHARGARAGSVEAVATVGVSNPASLPADPDGGPLPDRVVPDHADGDATRTGDEGARTGDDTTRTGEETTQTDGEATRTSDGTTRTDGNRGDETGHVGTVNVFVGTRRALSAGALANLVSVATEARAVTLQRAVGVPGTTSDAVVVASDPSGDPARFAGSATRVGAAARVCVREAIAAGLAARYADEEPPASVAEARHGIDVQSAADVFVPD